MTYRLFLLTGLLGLVLLAGLAVAPLTHRWDRSSVYMPADLERRLAAQPAAWMVRTVVVRGMIEPCPWWGAAARVQHCAGRPLVLIGPANDAPAAPLPLVQAAPSPLWSFLHRLPWLGDRLPQSSLAAPFAPARYRVRPQRLAASSCGGRSPCYAAVLLGVEH